LELLFAIISETLITQPELHLRLATSKILLPVDSISSPCGFYPVCALILRNIYPKVSRKTRFHAAHYFKSKAPPGFEKVQSNNYYLKLQSMRILIQDEQSWPAADASSKFNIFFPLGKSTI